MSYVDQNRNAADWLSQWKCYNYGIPNLHYWSRLNQTTVACCSLRCVRHFSLFFWVNRRKGKEPNLVLQSSLTVVQVCFLPSVDLPVQLPDHPSTNRVYVWHGRAEKTDSVMKRYEVGIHREKWDRWYITRKRCDKTMTPYIFDNLLLLFKNNTYKTCKCVLKTAITIR